MNKRELYDSFEELEKQTKFTLSQIERIKAEMGKVIEKNAELEIENQHLREHLHEIEQKQKGNKPSSRCLRKTLQGRISCLQCG